MTKSWEQGVNEFTDRAKREAMRAGVPYKEILARQLEEAKQGKDKKRIRKLIQALKYADQRNKK